MIQYLRSMKMSIHNEKETYDCPVEALANLLGKKWIATIICTINHEKKRFGELEKELEGCTRKMLTQQLELLMKQEIVRNQKEINGNSIESHYYLSEKGLTLLPLVEEMIAWGSKNLKCDKSGRY